MSRPSLLLFRIVVLAFVGCCLPITAQAASSVQATPVLQSDAAIVAALSALGPNEAAVLGKARLVGDFNDVARRFDLHRTGPRGRDYSIKMVWAKDRGRALFAGANHGQPHRLNDVWEFDLGALTWVLRYPPDNPRSYAGLGDDPSDVEYRNGVLATRRGGPAIVGHTWWGLAYHPQMRRLLWMNLWVSDLDKLVAQMGGSLIRATRACPCGASTRKPRAGNYCALRGPPRAPPWRVCSNISIRSEMSSGMPTIGKCVAPGASTCTICAGTISVQKDRRAGGLQPNPQRLSRLATTIRGAIFSSSKGDVRPTTSTSRRERGPGCEKKTRTVRPFRTVMTLGLLSSITPGAVMACSSIFERMQSGPTSPIRTIGESLSQRGVRCRWERSDLPISTRCMMSWLSLMASMYGLIVIAARGAESPLTWDCMQLEAASETVLAAETFCEAGPRFES